MSILRAVLVGHLFIVLPTLVNAVLFAWLGIELWGPKPLGAYILASVIPTKFWVSFATPRWQKWALQNGADRERLMRISCRALLTRRSDWADEKVAPVKADKTELL